MTLDAAQFVDNGANTPGVVVSGSSPSRDEETRDRYEIAEVSAAEGQFKPALVYLYKEGADSDKFVGRVFNNRPEMIERGDNFLRLKLEASKLPLEFFRKYRISRLPALVVLDHNGTPRHRFQGTSTSQGAVLQAMDRILTLVEREKARAKAIADRNGNP